tara:strand:+ start:172 stop:315 length:144 start_codon:yes stop_codon:yes gene_type:complete
MGDFKIYGINMGAIFLSLSDVNPILQTLVLLATLIYTVTNIIQKFKK